MDLISSGSTDTYKENKNNYFRNHFGSPISVPPHFEVGLSEISYIPAIETLNFDGKIEKSNSSMLKNDLIVKYLE